MGGREVTNIRINVADLFYDFTQHKNFLRGLTIFDVDRIDEQLTLADEKLSESEFEDVDLAKEILGECASKVRAGDELHDLFTRFRKCVWETAYAVSCGRIEELAAKANIWRRTAPDTLSKSPDGVPDEYLMWSLFNDLKSASKEDIIDLKDAPSRVAQQGR